MSLFRKVDCSEVQHAVSIIISYVLTAMKYKVLCADHVLTVMMQKVSCDDHALTVMTHRLCVLTMC